MNEPTEKEIHDERLEARIEILLERERRDIHEWYSYRLHALQEWARQQEESICNAVFGCLANGEPLVTGRSQAPNYAARINILKYSLKKSEREVMELKTLLKTILDVWDEHKIIGPTVYQDARAAIEGEK